MLKTQVKASSITNLTDARYFAAWEVKWLGFNLDANAENYIQPHIMKAIKEWVDGVEIIGEFGMQTAAGILEAVKVLELEAVQVDQFANVELVKELSGITVIKEIIVEKTISEAALLVQIQDFAPYCSQFLLDFERNGLSYADLKKGNVFSLNFIKNLCDLYPIILSINCPAEEVEQLIEEIKPEGLSVKGGEEEQVGMKSFDELDAFFEAIEILI